MGVGRHLGFSTSGFFQVQSYNIDMCHIGMLDPENIGTAIRIALLASLGGGDVMGVVRHLRFSTSGFLPV